METTQNAINDIAAKHLGQSGSYAVYTDKFDPSLLVPMPRNLAREDWGIKGDEFIGCDVWHCYESTFLTNNGLPVAGTLKVIYDSSSECMVESKSIKLYLNSFDMCKMGETVYEATKNYESQVQKDLFELLKVTVQVCFFPNESETDYRLVQNPAIGYKVLESEVENINDIVFTDYLAQEKHFKVIPSGKDNVYKLTTNILRSRCRHTKQKDSGTAFFHIETKNAEVDLVSLLKEIVSLREVNEFHEFCCEKLFVELKSHPEITNVCVMLLYSRRGSWDINPIRATSMDLIPDVFKSANIYTTKQQSQ